MSNTIKAILVLGTTAVLLAACAQKEAPAPAPEPMVMPEPTSGKM